MQPPGEHTVPPWIDELAAAVAFRLSHSPDALWHVAEMEETLLSLADLRRRLGLSKDETVLRLVKTGGLPMFKIAGRWRTTRKAYRQAAQRQFQPPKLSHRKISIGQP